VPEAASPRGLARPLISGLLACAGLGLSSSVRADDVPGTGWHLSGDLGIGVVQTSPIAPGASSRRHVIPYAYADAGPLFAREDTFGVKLVPMGWGSLELAARYSTEGTDSDAPGLAHRANPRPVGLGTFQETPWGGVFLNAFVDTVSGGSLLEASYAAQFGLGPVTFYPQIGLARRSERYVNHLYGVGAGDSGGLPAYRAGAALTPTLSGSMEWPVGPHWVLIGHVERERFDRAITDSPRVDAAGRTVWLVAFARRFD